MNAKEKFVLSKILIKAVWDEIEILSNYADLYGPPLDLPPEEEVILDNTNFSFAFMLWVNLLGIVSISFADFNFFFQRHNTTAIRTNKTFKLINNFFYFSEYFWIKSLLLR
jgi:hypothetical protein